MKGILKDRIDVLFEKAKAGDCDAQLELARNFYKGRLVEKSIDQAKYWAFKSASAGNESAISFYQMLTLDIKDNNNNSVASQLGLNALILSVVELCVGFIGHLFTSKNSTADKICSWMWIVGLVSLILGLVSMGLVSETKNKEYALKIGFVTITIVHLVALYIALK